ncbi:unnamed protein product [Acanthocheilonema viteae]|uniref:Uncharacterized protein n=1 Tax=Acanthocheilonema viteae TaxID=6277 RepID=A0A498SGU6_ACAVI|nr:unnamed protein product [Acanthocheilonema viteae]
MTVGMEWTEVRTDCEGVGATAVGIFKCNEIPIAFGGSLSWLEFSVIEYETISLILAPILAILQGLTTIGLIIPAFYSWIDSTISADASWESIDYLNLTPHHFMVLEQTKFWIASIGQWFVQNMAHATIFALTGKIVMLGALVRYFTEIKQRQKTDYNDLSLTLFN